MTTAMHDRLFIQLIAALVAATSFAVSCAPRNSKRLSTSLSTGASPSATSTSTRVPPNPVDMDRTQIATATPLPHVVSAPVPSQTPLLACPPEEPSQYPEWAVATLHTASLPSLGPEDMQGLVFSHDVLPYGLDVITGTLVMEEALVLTPHPESVDYVLLHVRRAGSDAIWLTRGLCTAAGISYQYVVDVLDVFPLPRTQVFFSHGCALNGSEDPEILAILAAEHPIPLPYSNINPLGGSSNVIRAWRASRSTGRFVQIPTEGIRCEISGEGRSFHWDEP